MSFGFARVRQLDYFWAQLEEGAVPELKAASTTADAPIASIQTVTVVEESETDESMGGVCPCCLRGE